MADDSPVFSKTYGNLELYHEGLRNSLEAWEVSRNSVVFRAPGIVRFDEPALVIEFELLRGWISVLELLRSWRFHGLDRTELLGLFGRIGHALEEYHRATDKIHGDLFPDNVLFRPGDPRVSFVDFSRPAQALFPDGAPYDRGTVYTDLALFAIYTLVKYTPLRLPHAFRPTNRKLARAFLAGYFEHAGSDYDPEAFRAEYERLFRQGGVLPRTFMWRYFRWSSIFRVDDLAP